MEMALDKGLAYQPLFTVQPLFVVRRHRCARGLLCHGPMPRIAQGRLANPTRGCHCRRIAALNVA